MYLKREGDNICWGVKDTGQGISDKFAKTIFQKFVRIGNEETRLEKGTGLGLYIVKQLLQAQGAEISYEPNEPHGSNFKILHYDE